MTRANHRRQKGNIGGAEGIRPRQAEGEDKQGENRRGERQHQRTETHTDSERRAKRSAAEGYKATDCVMYAFLELCSVCTFLLGQMHHVVFP